jgi:hypothetical protein
VEAVRTQRCALAAEKDRAMKLRWPWRKREKGWTCTRVRQYWDEYIEDQLSVQDKFEYEAHLAVCRECQSRLAETRGLIEASHKLGEKLRQDWRERTADETAEQYFQRLEGKLLGRERRSRKRS